MELSSGPPYSEFDKLTNAKPSNSTDCKAKKLVDGMLRGTRDSSEEKLQKPPDRQACGVPMEFEKKRYVNQVKDKKN
ncbi:unnamed protein product [Caenorhabditis auriculariae]|uniref:Uncharacterized protein n=1 Tax=Caenorhabditis auriculariae TaxID=2777116 RepID=A0A8S1H7W8_9PELO|nr:unnamed protein product [Caenorhabditis auriculariae]